MIRLALLLAVLTLTGCAGLRTPETARYEPPASCLEPAEPIPEPYADLFDYASTLIVQYTELAVQREQCRAALTRP